MTLVVRRFCVPVVLAVFSLAALVSIASFGIGSPVPAARADTSYNVSGFAWSDTIGWVSFNCNTTGSCATSNYGVNVDNGGNFSGYAWSSSIGWISFNATTGCPEAGCVTRPKMDRNTGEVTGWARACKGTINGDCTGASRTDGWDGWIQLSGTTPSGAPYGVTFDGSAFTGYSWGSEVVGWLSWGGSGYAVTLNLPLICNATLTASPDTVQEGQNTYFSWSVTAGRNCASTCTGSGFNTGGATSGNNVPASVLPSPPSTSYGLTCTGGTRGVPPTVNTTVTVLVPSVTITANGQLRAARVNPATPNNATIAWSSQYAASCAVTKNGAAWRTGTSSPGVTDSVTSQTVYTASCQNGFGTATSSSVTVNVLAGFEEF